MLTYKGVAKKVPNLPGDYYWQSRYVLPDGTFISGTAAVEMRRTYIKLIKLEFDRQYKKEQRGRYV